VFINLVAMATASAPAFLRPDLMRSTRQTSLVAGGAARLRCEARAKPMPQIVWFKDDAILNVPVTWSLQLGHVTVEDGALYTCVVYNHIAVISFSYNVTVESSY